MKLKRILIAGEGGQGIQTLAHLLSRDAYNQKKRVTYLPNFGVEQRGGVSLAFIQISDDEISFPKFQKADVIVLFAPRAIKRVQPFFKKDSLLIFDNSLISEKALSHLAVDKMALPASRIAKEKLVPKVFNIIILASVIFELGLNPKKSLKLVEEYFAEKYQKEPELKHFNKKAFLMGYDMSKEVTGK